MSPGAKVEAVIEDRNEKATKADDAAVPVHLWSDSLVRARLLIERPPTPW